MHSAKIRLDFFKLFTRKLRNKQSKTEGKWWRLGTITEFKNLSAILDQRTQIPQDFYFLFSGEVDFIFHSYFIILMLILIIIFLLIFFSICHVPSSLLCDHILFYQAQSMCTYSMLSGSEELSNLPTFAPLWQRVRAVIRLSDPKAWLSINLYLPYFGHVSTPPPCNTRYLSWGMGDSSQRVHVSLGTHSWYRLTSCRGSWHCLWNSFQVQRDKRMNFFHFFFLWTSASQSQNNTNLTIISISPHCTCHHWFIRDLLLITIYVFAHFYETEHPPTTTHIASTLHYLCSSPILSPDPIPSE